ISSLREIKGRALKILKSFDEIVLEPKIAALTKQCPFPDCRLCLTSCVYEALSRSEQGPIIIDRHKCSGCGLCMSICPEKCFNLSWKRP
ncbi:MAG: 4Fe-4S binding protein, partial [Spirochaetes bacterium]|nr:4Fe-4S binding protein [Spirochaetota bacterium]